MSRGLKETFPQRIHTDGGEPLEKVLNITNYQRNTNEKLQKGVPSCWSEWPSSKSLQTIHVEDSVEKGNPPRLLEET